MRESDAKDARVIEMHGRASRRLGHRGLSRGFEVHAHIHTCSHIYIHMHIHAHTCTHMHTHAHTHIDRVVVARESRADGQGIAVQRE